MCPACSVLSPPSSRCRCKAGEWRKTRGPKKDSKSQVTLKSCLHTLYKGCAGKVLNNVTMCYGKKPCGMDAKLPKEGCDAKLPDQQNCVFALTKGSAPP